MFCAHVHTYTHRQVFWKVQMLLLDLHSLDSSTLKLKVQPHSLQPVRAGWWSGVGVYV